MAVEGAPVDVEELVRDVTALLRVERSAATDERRLIAGVRRDLERLVGPAVTQAATARLLGVSPTALANWVRTGDVATVDTDMGRDLVPLGFLVGLLEEVEAARATRRRPLSFVLRRRAERAAHEIDVADLLPEIADGFADGSGHRRAELRSLALHRLIARRLDERVVDEARHRVQLMRAGGAVHPRLADAWDRLLEMPVDEIAGKLGENSLEMRELRQATPFTNVLNEHERRAVITRVGAALAA
jgi:hypothetical protein